MKRNMRQRKKATNNQPPTRASRSRGCHIESHVYCLYLN